MELPEDSPVCEAVRDIEASALRAAELTREMLAYSGKGRFVVQPLNLGSLAEEAILLSEPRSRGAGIAIRRRFAPNLPFVEGDANQLRQVIKNLIANALDAIGERPNGFIEVSTSVVDADEDYLIQASLFDDLPKGRYTCLTISDNGCGMTQDVKARIFDPFFTTKFKGRGLGLAAALGIVRGHRGAIRVYTEPDMGSTFKILFPCFLTETRAEDAPAGAAAPTPPLAASVTPKTLQVALAQAPAAPAGPNETETLAQNRAVPGPQSGEGIVLIADDEPGVRLVASKTLKRAGFEVLQATDGDEAVEIFRQRSGEIACVLLDLVMPRVSGEKAFALLREIRPDIPVVLMSGFSEHEAIGRFAGQGLAAFIQKPFQPRELLAKAREALDRAAPKRPPSELRSAASLA
jgi:CheY-like chemotaxis protein/two-component sensor histidine kinase